MKEIKYSILNREIILLIAILLLYILIATFRIDEIPGEWYGDTSIFHEYVLEILSGQWPFYFTLAAGPFHNYFIAPIISILGTSYLSYKLASIFIGLVGIVFIYLLSKSLFSPAVGLLTSLITTISFWYLAWSRLGNPEIITVPILTSSMGYFLTRFIDKEKWKDMIFGIIAASLGLFTYVATFILPVVYLLILTTGFYVKKVLRNKRKTIFLAAVSFVPTVTLLLWMILRQPDNFTTGYVGVKIFTIFQEDPYKVLGQFIKNIVRTILMLHIEGDVVFRWNVPKSSQLDVLSGVFFLGGLLYWWKQKRKTIFFVLIPLLLLPLPSLSPALPPVEIPNSARTIGIIPFVYLLVALGLLSFATFLSERFGKTLSRAVVICLIVIIAYLNFYKYFVFYPQDLPNKNTPFGKIIASYIDTLPLDTKIYLTSCCWGEWGQPEPKGIYYVLKNKRGRENIIHESFIQSCSEVPRNRNTLIIFSPHDSSIMSNFQQCFPHGVLRQHIVSGQDVFTSLLITK